MEENNWDIESVDSDDRSVDRGTYLEDSDEFDEYLLSFGEWTEEDIWCSENIFGIQNIWYNKPIWLWTEEEIWCRIR